MSSKCHSGSKFKNSLQEKESMKDQFKDSHSKNHIKSINNSNSKTQLSIEDSFKPKCSWTKMYK